MAAELRAHPLFFEDAPSKNSQNQLRAHLPFPAPTSQNQKSKFDWLGNLLRAHPLFFEDVPSETIKTSYAPTYHAGAAQSKSEIES